MAEYKVRKGTQEARSKEWKEIEAEFGGYLKAMSETNIANLSNLHYLKSCKKTLTKAGLLSIVKQIEIVLTDFKMAGY